VSYQSTLNAGFSFLQARWSNNVKFPPQHTLVAATSGVNPGFDPIIGANSKTANRDRTMSGVFVTDLSKEVNIAQDFVEARGGEYFFVPSLSTLKQLASGQLSS